MTIEELSKIYSRFLFEFNEIEAATYDILDILPDDSLVKHGKSIDQFKNRARFVQALLKSASIEHKEELYQLLEESISLSGYRNKLAHNPLRVSISRNDKGDIHTGYCISSSKDGSTIPQVLEQLPSKLQKTTRIVLRFAELI
jgi:acetylglutamate synthase